MWTHARVFSLSYAHVNSKIEIGQIKRGRRQAGKSEYEKKYKGHMKKEIPTAQLDLEPKLLPWSLLPEAVEKIIHPLRPGGRYQKMKK